MSSLEEQIVEIEDEIRKTQYNKATQGHIGRLRAKISYLKLEREKRAASKGGGGAGYSVRKSGNATVGLVGYPSVGKSTLLTRLTGAMSEAGAYDFTTVSIIPGMLRWGAPRSRSSICPDWSQVPPAGGAADARSSASCVRST